MVQLPSAVILEPPKIKNTRHSKGTFHAKMGTIKDRNGMSLPEAEDIKKRWQARIHRRTVQKRSS